MRMRKVMTIAALIAIVVVALIQFAPPLVFG
jgi:hypothetical protein